MTLRSHSERLMGTTITISLVDEQADIFLQKSFDLLKELEYRFNANSQESELMEINYQAGIAPVTVHPDLFELISLGLEHSLALSSHLNISIGPLIQTWRIGFSDAKVAQPQEIESVLPLFNKPADKQVPAEILEIAAKIEEADGVIIGTPEYDHSIPAVLMSALAWLSYGIYPLLNKPIMITGASYGTLGSSRAQLQLRQILNAPEIKANVLPDEFLLSHSLQAFNPSGDLVDLDVIKKLDAIFDDFRIFVKITEKLRNAQELLRKDAEDFDWENL